MLPVVAGNAAAARAVLASTLALLLVSLLPLTYGAGPIYGVGALAGGSLFVVRAVALVRTPDDRRAAKRCFFASLVQLSLLLLAATLDVMAG